LDGPLLITFLCMLFFCDKLRRAFRHSIHFETANIDRDLSGQ